MQNLTGHFRKMRAELNEPINYFMIVGDSELALNECIGSTLHIEYQGQINCVQCGRKTNKSFQQGHCFPCMQRINECNNCIIHPERCLVEQGSCPHDDWAHSQCHAEHIVYLANTSGLKVGITRKTQVPTRWIDQGAMQAIPLFSTNNRYQSGLVEVAFKSYIADKTNWRVMLKQDSVEMDMHVEKELLLAKAQAELAPILAEYQDDICVLDAGPYALQFPVKLYPEKVTSLSLEKTPTVSGQLQGIKGQYLIFDTGVMNVRKFAGYLVSVAVS